MNTTHTNTQPTGATTTTYRALTSQLVTDVAVDSGEPQQAVYDRIFTRLLFLYGIDVYMYPRGRNESLLVVAERHDVIDKVYALAYAEKLYFQSYEE
ncbi:hypothetical protein GO755_30400 [Spirosoma sp. HMF4905]|uniref:Uncharacterized protein n=1 Tax=Spirosoma arboris TaxID=2682092 RepID=A0A7K1SKP1_9BACT|nr:hypothetical protein [Spirosoma arboris]MVM34382.1 hypothetical protein [Spirosoma arboris]